ncbi:hypothetical protein [Silicimonas sp. MF1-12-2]|uniref:hypothetical protein n=1 Tax=Silicimonas sp. MF1-12-2 TaxID=3384793 RepID=UPI0039B44203
MKAEAIQKALDALTGKSAAGITTASEVLTNVQAEPAPPAGVPAPPEAQGPETQEAGPPEGLPPVEAGNMDGIAALTGLPMVPMGDLPDPADIPADEEAQGAAFDFLF